MKKIFQLLCVLVYFSSCTYDKPEIDLAGSNYPPEIAKIIVEKCATSGCHNSISRSVADGLDFSTWDLMFDGGRNCSSVIPFSTDNSYMLYSINTDSTKGPVLLPTMPYNETQLSAAEYNTLHDWIADGAPNKDGFVKFSDDPNRRKIYICMQACDKVAVIDAKTKVVMRYIDVGVTPGDEGPHMIRVSPDGQYFYVVFYSAEILQKFRTSDDSFVGQADLSASGGYNWNTIIITPDGKRGFVNGTGSGVTAIVDLDAMNFVTAFGLDQPHGGFATPDGRYVYITSQTGNEINKINTDSTTGYENNIIVLVPGQQPSTSSSEDPHEMYLSPDGSKYFVSCQKSNKVRVFQASNDSLIAVLDVGVTPQEFSASTTMPYIFVTCKEDPIDANRKGSVYIINYNDLSMQHIYPGYQPHGVVVDDAEGLVYITNLNYDQTGPAPHHVSECAGRNGYLTIIDMHTMQLYNKTLADGNSFQYKCELLVYPYSADIRK